MCLRGLMAAGLTAGIIFGLAAGCSPTMPSPSDTSAASLLSSAGTPSPSPTPTVTPAPSVTPTPTPIPANTFFLAPTGSDTTGDGSPARPWQTITYALAQASAGDVPTLDLAEGLYDEKLLITRSIILQGAGSTRTRIRNSRADDTDFVVTADGTAAPAPLAVTIRGLTIDGLYSKNPGLQVTRAVLVTGDLGVFAPGGYAIVLGPDIVGFVIDNTTIGFQGDLLSDVGITVGNHSSGTISNFNGGDHIDHIISIGVGCDVAIRDARLQGSTIYWADGIRIQGASNVTIQNVSIIRPASGMDAAAGPMHNPPYAGIEVATASDTGTLIRIDNCTISGFDVGIGFNMMGNRAIVQNCTVTASRSVDVQTIWYGTDASPHPVIDLGGGTLGGIGNNNFGTGPEPAVQLGGPYDVWALNNAWGVTGPPIEGRIVDQLDNATLGRVHY